MSYNLYKHQMGYHHTNKYDVSIFLRYFSVKHYKIIATLWYFSLFFKFLFFFFRVLQRRGRAEQQGGRGLTICNCGIQAEIIEKQRVKTYIQCQPLTRFLIFRCLAANIESNHNPQSSIYYRHPCICGSWN